MIREHVYGRRPVREALRGPREVFELWATERALRADGADERDQSVASGERPGARRSR